MDTETNKKLTRIEALIQNQTSSNSKEFTQMEGRFTRIEDLIKKESSSNTKKFVRIEELIDNLAIFTQNSFNLVDGKFETLEKRLSGKIEGVQRAVDAGFERHSALQVRVSKIETRLGNNTSRT